MHLFCRHDYEPVERVEDGAGETRLEVIELRCPKYGKTRVVTTGEREPVGQGDSRFGSLRRRS